MSERIHAFAAEARDLSSRVRIALVAAAASLLAATPLLAVETPPLFDLPAHVARLAVLMDQGASPRLDAMFDIQWELLPNLALELTAIPLAGIMSLDAAVWTFLLAALLLQLAGAAALSRAVYGRLTAPPFLAVFFLFNGVLNFGFASYVFAVGPALLALAAWILLRSRPPQVRIGWFVPMLAGLYVFHLYALGLFGLAAGAYELGCGARDVRAGCPPLRAARTTAGHLMVLATASTPAFAALFLFSPTAGALSETTWSDLWSLSAYAQKPEKLLFAFEAGISQLDRLLLAGFAATLAIGFLRGWLRFAPALTLPAILLWSTFLLMPQTVASSWGADLRMPLGAALISVAAIGWGANADAGTRIRFGSVLAVLCALRIGSVLAYWVPTSHDLTEIRDLLARVPRGAALTAAIAVEDRWRGFLEDASYHVGGYAMAERAVFYPTVFANHGQQPISWTPIYAAKSRAAGMIHWSREAIAAAGPGVVPAASALEVYDYVLVVRPAWFADRLSPRLELVARGSEAILMRVNRLTAAGAE